MVESGPKYVRMLPAMLRFTGSVSSNPGKTLTRAPAERDQILERVRAASRREAEKSWEKPVEHVLENGEKVIIPAIVSVEITLGLRSPEPPFDLYGRKTTPTG